MTVRARHVICLLHDAAAVEPIVARYPGFEIDREYSIDSPDPRMRKAFAASMDLVFPSMTDEDWAAIDAHRAVTYVLSPPIEPARAIEISTAALKLIADALAAGALAAKGESAGIAHGAVRWKQHAHDLRKPPSEIALYSAWVRHPIADGDARYTCGMHLLGLPDVEVLDVEDAGEMVHWLTSFALYQLVEAGQEALGDGHTFRPDTKSTRRVVRKVECTRYPEDDYFYNPHGYWRLEPKPEAKKKPAGTKPGAKPAATKPATKPAAMKPAASKPTATKPATTRFAATKPATKPAATKRVAKKPAEPAKKPAKKPAAKEPLKKSR